MWVTSRTRCNQFIRQWTTLRGLALLSADPPADELHVPRARQKTKSITMSDIIRPAQGPVTRRSFLKRSSSAVAGGALLGALPIERFAHGAVSPGDTLRIALVGCGGRGSGAADQALSTSGDVKLVAVADAFKERADGALRSLKKHENKIDVKDDAKFIGFDGYKQAIAMADVVILATPPGFRPIHF